jgi:hypothetical protein
MLKYLYIAINYKTMNKKTIYTIVGCLLVIMSAVFFYNSRFGSRTSSSGDSSGILISESESATTSPTYFTLGTTASSTLIIDTEYSSKLVLDVCLKASTTATGLSWKLDFDNTYSDSGLNWFGHRDYAETSSILRTWGASTVLNIWTPANATASTTCAHLYEGDAITAVKTRITYNVIGANGSVYLRASTK